MFKGFLEDFLQISTIMTLMLILLMFAGMYIIYLCGKKKFSFSKKVIIGTFLGLGLGLLIQIIAGFPNDPSSVVYVKEATAWYDFFGYSYMAFVKMLVIPLVMTTIIYVIINMDTGAKLSKLVKTTLVVTMSMVFIAAVVGLSLGLIFNIGGNSSVAAGQEEIRESTNLVSTLYNLIPSNPVLAMTTLNIIGLVIFSAFVGVAAKRMSGKYSEIIKPFNDVINAFYKIVVSMTISIIKFMPYAVIPLLANTIALLGIQSILDVGKFIIVLYLGLAIMFGVQLGLLAINKVNPIHFIKKGMSVFILAFTSRSSVGTLPVTIETLNERLGVNHSTASFVASFGTTAGMQGCAGVFPSLVIIYIAHVSGVEIDISFLVLSALVVTIGSVGIAGIPGTATMAASVALSGTGMASSFPLISPILAIDPLIDMGRTMINVSGAMANAIVVDKSLGQLNMEEYEAKNQVTNIDFD